MFVRYCLSPPSLYVGSLRTSVLFISVSLESRQGLAHSRYSVNVYWMNEGVKLFWAWVPADWFHSSRCVESHSSQDLDVPLSLSWPWHPSLSWLWSLLMTKRSLVWVEGQVDQAHQVSHSLGLCPLLDSPVVSTPVWATIPPCLGWPQQPNDPPAWF